MDNAYFLFVIFFILAATIRTGYELLKEAGKVDLENKFVFAMIFSVMGVLWIAWFTLCRLDPYAVSSPAAIRWVGLLIFAAGMFLAVGALIQLKGLENIKHLVTTGMFAKLRHPMYTGFIFWIIGWSMFHNARVSFFVGLAGIANILYWRHLEEKRLLAQFGDAYRKYKMTTWW